MSVLREPQQQAKHPVSLMAGPYGHPFHPILVTIPIGAWTASLVFDIASHVTTGHSFLAQGSLWLIVIGLIGALAWAAFVILLPVALLGFTMFFRWIGAYRATPAAVPAAASSLVTGPSARRMNSYIRRRRSSASTATADRAWGSELTPPQ